MKRSLTIGRIAILLLLFGGTYTLFDWGGRYFGGVFSRPFPTGIIRAMEGDSAHWKLRVYDDRHWLKKLPLPPGVYWWRTSVDLDTNMVKSKPLGLHIRSFLGSYEVYWDGSFIGANGRVGNKKEEEIPGGIDKLLLLPEGLSQPGTHLLALRVSQFYSTNYQTYPFLKLSGYDQQSQTLIVLAAFMHLFAGMFLIIAFYYFLLYVKSFRQPTFLIFSFLSLFLFAWMALEYLKFYYAYPYPFHFFRLEVISLLVLAIALLTTLFFLNRFQVPFGKWILGFQLAGQLLIIWLESDYDRSTFYQVNLSVSVSLSLSLWANFKQKLFAWESLLSIVPLLITAAFFYPLFYDQTLFIAYIFFMLINLYVLSKTVGFLRQQLTNASQQADLLKIALLKKNIQPHYLMNTLTSLISWVEESPRVAVQFIEALALEFEALSAVAEKKLIPVEEEIALCHSHLEVMTFRKEIAYKLKTNNIDPMEKIPPALFLTLLENGLTHNIIEEGNAIFSLDFQKDKAVKTYRFFAPGQSLQEKAEAGAGLSYIRARLQESYGKRWEMTSEASPEGWLTCIYINV